MFVRKSKLERLERELNARIKNLEIEVFKEAYPDREIITMFDVATGEIVRPATIKGQVNAIARHLNLKIEAKSGAQATVNKPKKEKK